MKNINDIWQEYLAQDVLSAQTINDLIWHIENDERPRAISRATDMIIENPKSVSLKKLIPSIVKQLDNEDDSKREFAVNCVIGRLKLAEHASKALDMAKNDPYDNVRSLATFNLGAVLDKVDFNLRGKIANYLYDVIMNNVYDDLLKQSAYGSVIEAMEVPIHMWPEKKLEPDIATMVDKDLLEEFKIKYNIEDKK